MTRPILSVLLLVTMMGSALLASLEQPGAQVQDLKTLSLEELMQIDVSTVSRYDVDTLVDALRLADSVSVARFNGGSWAIATRGFSAVTNNKLLVMIDGRSIYTQLFGDVFWEAQHVLLPTSTASRSSGAPPESYGDRTRQRVINIITKRASDTQGALVRAVPGSRERAHLAARFGGQINPQTSFRVYGVGATSIRPNLHVTVGESPRFEKIGGAVNLVLDSGRVRST